MLKWRTSSNQNEEVLHRPFSKTHFRLVCPSTLDKACLHSLPPNLSYFETCFPLKLKINSLMPFIFVLQLWSMPLGLLLKEAGDVTLASRFPYFIHSFNTNCNSQALLRQTVNKQHRVLEQTLPYTAAKCTMQSGLILLGIVLLPLCFH